MGHRCTRRAETIARVVATAQLHGASYESHDRNELRALRRRVKTGELVEVFPKQFANAVYWRGLARNEQARYIIKAHAHHAPETVFCAFSAALLHGLPVTYGLLDVLHIRTKTSSPSRGSRHIARLLSVTADDVRIDGVRVTPLVHTAIDCVRYASFADGLAIADALMRKLDIDRAVFGQLVDRFLTGRKGVDAARRVAIYADARAESGGESIARAVMIEAGIPPSDLQTILVDPVDTMCMYRADFLFRLRSGSTVIGELDGKEKYRDEKMLAGKDTFDALINERQRESRLTLLGMPIVRFTMKDVWTPGRLVALLAAAGVTPSTIAGRDYRNAVCRG